MTNLVSYLLANAYSAMAPAVNVAAAVCRINDQIVPCGSMPNLSSFPSSLTTSAALWGWGITMLVWFVIALFMVVTMWKLYRKAGQPGWASIIPIYNLVVMLQIVGKPVWWIILMLIPFVNIIVGLIVAHNTSRVFGKDIGYTLGLIFLPFIFYPILAFGKSIYTPPQTTPAQPIIS